LGDQNAVIFYIASAAIFMNRACGGVKRRSRLDQRQKMRASSTGAHLLT
jgi:hypothetical protein